MSYLDEIPITPIADKSSIANRTGTWRTFRPVIDYEKCTRCMICWKFCPDAAIRLEDGSNYAATSDRIKQMIDKAPVIDYDHCKGCGICANECPVDAIQMVKEE